MVVIAVVAAGVVRLSSLCASFVLSVSLRIDEGALLFRKIAIVSAYDQKPVTAAANYSMLPSGQVYMAQAIG